MDQGEVEGIFIFDVATIAEAKTSYRNRPCHTSRRTLVMELRPFYCSAALKEVAKNHKKLAKKNFAD
jgi:hypothetical protein